MEDERLAVQMRASKLEKPEGHDVQQSNHIKLWRKEEDEDLASRPFLPPFVQDEAGRGG